MQWIIIISGKGLSLVQHQAITWSNAELLEIGLKEKKYNFDYITNISFMKMHFKMSVIK